MTTDVGVIGLGIMGSAMAANLLKGGFAVIGRDVAPEAAGRLAGIGGEVAPSPRAVAERAAIVITSLPSAEAFHAVVSGADGLAAGGRDGLIVIETSTLAIADKEHGRAALAAAGMTLLDCPLSGTGTQAVVKDLMVFASGDRDAVERCVEVLEGFARAHRYVGEFGNGSRMKFVANHLINVHNVAAAEAMVLGMKAGLDPDLVYDVIANSAATSRMFEVRGAMMARGDYDEAGMKIEMWRKDLRLIGEFAAAVECPTPLFAAAAQPYRTAMAHGLGEKDTAAVCAVLEDAAGVRRKG